MTTALGVITSALKKNGALTKGEVPSPDEAVDALQTLNDILASWSNEAINIYSRVTESFTLTPNVSSYSIGSGQTFNTARPIIISSAYIRVDATDYIVQPISEDNYNMIGDKSTQDRPVTLTYIQSYPYGTIKLWPNPIAAYSLYITSEKEISELELSTVLSLPPGWRKALVDALAIELAPEYGQQVSQVMYEAANESKAAISRAIIKNKSMDCPRAINSYARMLEGYRV